MELPSAPPSFEAQSHVRLTIEPERADMILLRRISSEQQADQALLPRPLWPMLGLVTILEYRRRPRHLAFLPGDLLRLVSYGLLYEAAHLDELPQREDLTLVLVIASVTPPVLDEIKRMGGALTPLGGGYARIDGAVHTTYVVVTDEQPEAARDEYLQFLFDRRPSPGDATRWLEQWMRETKIRLQDIEELPGFVELFKKALNAVSIEERLVGLTPQQLILALPPETLRALPKEHLDTLSDKVQVQIRQRLQEAAS